MFKGGFSFCMNSISYKRHSNLPLHFLKTVMFSVRSLGMLAPLNFNTKFFLSLDNEDKMSSKRRAINLVHVSLLFLLSLNIQFTLNIARKGHITTSNDLTGSRCY